MIRPAHTKGHSAALLQQQPLDLAALTAEPWGNNLTQANIPIPYKRTFTNPNEPRRTPMSALTSTTGAIDSSFTPVYKRVIGWVAAQMAVATLTALILGPMIPPTMIMGINLAVVAGLIVMSFVRVSPSVAPVIALIVPAAIGLIVYVSISHYLNAGMGNIVIMAAASTMVIFTTLAVMAWRSERSIEGWSGKMFAILLGLIALSILNIFLKMTMLSLIISGAGAVLFSLYIFMDIQRIRDLRQDDNATASMYALNIFLDIVNLFLNLLNILGILSRR
jgi:uncharacterized protein yetJ